MKTNGVNEAFAFLDKGKAICEYCKQSITKRNQAVVEDTKDGAYTIISHPRCYFREINKPK